MDKTQILENKWERAQLFGTVYGTEEAAAMINVLADGAGTNGSYVRRFENTFAGYVGAAYGVAANSWVGAAQLLAIAMEIRAGDEFIVPGLTFQASANVFQREGAKIVFADSDPRTFNIDPDKLEGLITEKTRAIVAVHMCGQPADMDAIDKIAKKYNLLVIQDAAHAPGSLYRNRKLGEYGDYIIYSFHQGKNLSTLGEGGMLVTNHRVYIGKMRSLRAHGAAKYLGISSRMTEIQGAVGLEQLKKLKKHNQKRRALAYHLTSQLKDVKGIRTPYELESVYHNYHIYNLLIEPEKLGISRKDFIRRLWTRFRIVAATQYFPTVNCLPAYRRLGYGEGVCPVAEELSAQLVSLPVAPSLELQDMEELAAAIKQIALAK